MENSNSSSYKKDISLAWRITKCGYILQRYVHSLLKGYVVLQIRKYISNNSL